jgi:hypothetical protein
LPAADHQRVEKSTDVRADRQEEIVPARTERPRRQVARSGQLASVASVIVGENFRYP